MTIVFRIVRLIALAIWVGGLVFFGFVAAVAFKTLPNVHEAGLVYLLVTLALLTTQGDSHPVRAAELLLVLIMLVLTGYSEFSVIPRMEADRVALGGDVSIAPADSPALQHFDRLHKVSVRVEGAVLIAGLLLLGLAPVHGRDDFDRFG